MNQREGNPIPIREPRRYVPPAPMSWPAAEKVESPATAPPPPPSRKQRSSDPTRTRLIIAWAGLLIFIGAIGVIDMPGMFWAGDPSIWREETRAILKTHSLVVDPVAIPFVGEKGQALVENPRNGQLYSKYGLMNSLMSLPPMWLDMKLLGGSMTPLLTPDLLISNLWNVLLSILLAAVLMKLSALYTARISTRIIFVLATFYGTYLWYYLRAQSSEIYQTLFYTSAFLLLVTFLRGLEHGQRSPWRLDLAWLFVGMLVLSRILYLLLIPLILVYVALAIMRSPRQQWRAMALRLSPHLLIPPLLIVGLLGLINYVKFGSPLLSGYHQWHPEQHLPTIPILGGLRGFLLMPRFSIFYYYPPLLIAMLQIWPFVRRFPLDAIVALGTAAAFILLLSKIPTWAGEWTYGPRYVLFAMPALGLPLILFIDWLIDNRHRVYSWPLAATATALVIYSSYLTFRVNQLGFFAYYRIRLPLEATWSNATQNWFMEHHVGVVIDDLIRHRDDLDAMPWYAEMKQTLPPAVAEDERNRINDTFAIGNHYWWPRENSPEPKGK